ncbi:uncharacterized protein LOC119436271 [Dermacentor silvarum]|uniref:uncharacterized protein LOC119436271 n=1 Tax=Dermacentor silvarum TaxID=543639 RepID=UPI00189B45D2|nr:uncharacterized protein LOC119436271 [Dermacentor silvarum]
MTSQIKISVLALLACCFALASSHAGMEHGAGQHVYAGGEDYPHGFVVRTVHEGEDRHGHRGRGYGHGHRDYVNEPEYVVRSPYGALLQQSESQHMYATGAAALGLGGALGHEHAAFFPGHMDGYLMAR